MSDVPFAGRKCSAPTILDRAFYQRTTVDVARCLLGKVLVRNCSDGEVCLRIIEVEAYLGPDDPACHTRGGRKTPRVNSMWGEGGRAYVYLVYGMHHCLNVVTVGGAGEAVLIRGGTLMTGGKLVRRRRGPRVRDRDLLNGPGKICKALAVDLRRDGCDLCDQTSGLWLGDDGYSAAADRITRFSRIGVDYAGEAASWPLRFVLEGEC